MNPEARPPQAGPDIGRDGSPDPPRTALLVLGMHRSGTSALARMLSLLGAELPEHVLGARRGNEAGHWEPERLVMLHDEMLTEAGSRWDDWRGFDPASLGKERLAHYREEISRLIEEEYGEARLFVLKDPRICRFVPLYEELLAGMGVAPRFVLTYRNPISVLDSLAARDGMASAHAAVLWLRHVLDAEAATRGRPRVFLSYEECLNDWRAAAGKTAAALGIEWPRDPDEAAREIGAQLSPGLQHHAATPADLEADRRIGRAVREAYAALLALSADEGDAAALEALSRARAELEAGEPAALGLDAVDWADIASRVFTEMATRQYRDRRDREHLQRLVAKHRREAENLERRLERLLEEHKREAEARSHNIRRLQKRNRELEAEVSALRRSTSWRLTRPLRAAVRLLTDPRGTIAFLRAGRARRPAASPQAASPPPPKAETPPPDEERF
ncbi:hypothetical protein Rxycam_01929 [Rubrobacter xylanophilus DSM 9941]|uniref:sulfotransferase family protein n=1 Tax=Rubrobacter xylanophilus TaxID=49319 RepID=UPI001C63FA97|nr:sulfotransferase [Rubrobacter xylanophilus]QYJ16098.1 hypothetical protein Rxycam_01929 [Rubrobacter xylanophilus DSM 9941]